MKQSPSGSLCPYHYMGGELHPLKYGSYHQDKEALFAVMQAEETFIMASAGDHNRRIWIDLYETHVDGEVAEALVRHLQQIQGKTFRLCLVGCSMAEKARIRRRLKKEMPEMAETVRFYSDPEEAKRWLVGKVP